MSMLILGLVLFFGAHLLPISGGLRAGLISTMGAGGYKGAFALASFAGLILVIIGFRSADEVYLYDPLDYRAARGLAHAALPVAFILVAGANMKSNLKRFIRHPMSLGVLIWAGVHLAANGDVASALLFGSFAVFSILDMLVISKRKDPPPVQPRSKDLILVVAGTVAYGAAMFVHGMVGPAVMG